MLLPIPIPGLFVTATDTGVGKTIVAAAIADHFHRRGVRVGVFKPVASGCARTASDSLASEDAEMLRAVVGNRFDSATINPVRFAQSLAPAVAARQSDCVLDWALISDALARVVEASDVIIVEGAGGLMVPLDDQSSILDLIRWLQLPTICVSRPNLGTINHTALTVEALRAARVECAGVVINRFDATHEDLSYQSNAQEIARFVSVPVRCVVPESYFDGYSIPESISQAIDTVDWSRLARLG
jgi:dethiobiotin synthetase